MVGPARRAVARAFRGAPARAVAGIFERLVDAPPGRYGVLTYHRVDDPGARPWLYPALLSATPTGFEHQMRELAAHYRPIGLQDLLAAHRGERALPRRAVLVTFDDAYRDFEEHAWPILRQLGIQATLFVPTAYPDAGHAFWWDRLWDAVRKATVPAIDTPVGRLELTGEGDRHRAVRALVDFHKGIAHDEAMRSVAILADRLGTAQVAHSAVLGWNDLRALSREGVHVAGHSRTHPVMTRVPAELLAEEILGSQRDLERELPEASYGSVFAYPTGQHDLRTRSALSELGIELAFTTERGVNHVGRDDPFALHRVNVGARTVPELIRAQLTFYTLRYPAAASDLHPRNGGRD
jgi:peptidoglycan/xylan/chitin deacetylase (PgdA/CDA1 family)